MLAGLAFCEMLSQYPRSAFPGLARVTRGGQQQFATQTLRVHLLGLEGWNLSRQTKPKNGQFAGRFATTGYLMNSVFFFFPRAWKNKSIFLVCHLQESPSRPPDPKSPKSAFAPLCCDPDCLVQPPNSWIPPEPIGEGASSLFGGWPESPENVSCSR